MDYRYGVIVLSVVLMFAAPVGGLWLMSFVVDGVKFTWQSYLAMFAFMLLLDSSVDQAIKNVSRKMNPDADVDDLDLR